MTDVHDKAVRSYNMSRIRSKNTKPELAIRKFLYNNGFRFRLHIKDLPGKPDILLRKYNCIIFINGCFWHGHENCSFFKWPQTRQEWWKNKIERNIANDVQNCNKLTSMGYRVFTIWECEIKDGRIFNYLVDYVRKK